MKTKGSMVRERQLQTSSRIRLVMYIDDNEGTLTSDSEKLRGTVATENIRPAVYIVYIDYSRDMRTDCSLE
jgi:hypothetical protein